MIKLKLLTKEDLPFLLEVRNNESTRKYLENDSVFNLEQCAKWFNDTQPKWYIILNKEEQKVGYLRTNDDEVGCDIHPNYRRKGYARLAYNEYLKDKDYATLWVFEDNFAINLYESLGFKTYGEFKMLRSRKYVYMIYKKDQSKKSCYVVNFYFGDRRKTITEFESDRLIFLKKQIEVLSLYYHNLDKIIFNFNVENEHYKYLNDALKIIPKKIQNTDVEVLIRENKGFSYGAWSDSFEKNRDKYDYFIFNEDDYFVIENNWDEYLIRKYHTLPDTGYLCPVQRDEDEWNDYKPHAGHSFGIASTKSLNKVWEKYGHLPHSLENNYKLQEKIQHNFSYAFFEVGLRVYDIREDYRVQFAMTEDKHQDIWRWFWWNEKDFIVPALILLNKPHTWWESWDGPCQRRTNLEKYN